MSSARNKRLVVSALMLALALVLPYFTGGIPAIGNLLLPMHLPVLLCGFLCGLSLIHISEPTRRS